MTYMYKPRRTLIVCNQVQLAQQSFSINVWAGIFGDYLIIPFLLLVIWTVEIKEHMIRCECGLWDRNPNQTPVTIVMLSKTNETKHCPDAS
ncbi:hypothetical protein TNCV_1519301 [Trichonephila clavipes]|nr:hypothetical protein TNCV_1519301 [Trichonephila clavipes]